MTPRKISQQPKPSAKSPAWIHASTPKKKVNRWAWLCLGLGLTSIATLSAAAGAWLALSLSTTPLMRNPLSPEDAAVFEDDSLARTNLRFPELTRPVNILVLGTKVLTSDIEPSMSEQYGYHALVNSLDGLSDTMLLARFNPETQRMVLLNIPRDTRAYIEGVGTTRINAANAEGGPALSAKAITELLGGITVDRYLRINVQGIEKLVDALGGVTLYVPRDMKYVDHSQHLYIDLKEGEQHLNGEQALQFLRFRYDGLGDIGRIQRQQLFVRALMEQTLSPVTLVRLPKMLSILQAHIDTNLSVEELVALAGFAIEHRSDAQMLMLPGDFGNVNEYGYWLPNYEKIDTLVADYFDVGWRADNYQPVDRSALRVTIQDSTGDRTAVATLVDRLTEEGYWNVTVGESWSEPLQKTRIVAQNGDVESAAVLRQFLGMGEVRVESTGNLLSDVTIQVGRDWLETYQSVENTEFR